MGPLSGAFRTFAEAEVDPIEVELVQPGHAYWSAMELIGPHWFLVEGWPDRASSTRPERHFFSAVEQAIAGIERCDFKTVRLVACLETPSMLHGDVALGEVVEVLTSIDKSRVLMRFWSGLEVMMEDEQCVLSTTKDSNLTTAFRSRSYNRQPQRNYCLFL